MCILQTARSRHIPEQISMMCHYFISYATTCTQTSRLEAFNPTELSPCAMDLCAYCSATQTNARTFAITEFRCMEWRTWNSRLHTTPSYMRHINTWHRDLILLDQNFITRHYTVAKQLILFKNMSESRCPQYLHFHIYRCHYLPLALRMWIWHITFIFLCINISQRTWFYCWNMQECSRTHKL